MYINWFCLSIFSIIALLGSVLAWNAKPYGSKYIILSIAAYSIRFLNFGWYFVFVGLPMLCLNIVLDVYVIRWIKRHGLESFPRMLVNQYLFIKILTQVFGIDGGDGDCSLPFGLSFDPVDEGLITNIFTLLEIALLGAWIFWMIRVWLKLRKTAQFAV